MKKIITLMLLVLVCSAASTRAIQSGVPIGTSLVKTYEFDGNDFVMEVVTVAPEIDVNCSLALTAVAHDQENLYGFGFFSYSDERVNLTEEELDILRGLTNGSIDIFDYSKEHPDSTVAQMNPVTNSTNYNAMVTKRILGLSTIFRTMCEQNEYLGDDDPHEALIVIIYLRERPKTLTLEYFFEEASRGVKPLSSTEEPTKTPLLSPLVLLALPLLKTERRRKQ